MFEVSEIESAQWLVGRRAHLEHHEPGAGTKHPPSLAKARVEVGQVPDSPPHNRAVEGRVGKRQRQSVRRHRCHPVGLLAAQLQHGLDEVGAHNRPPESGLPGQCRREVEGAGAEVEVPSCRHPLPVEPPKGLPPPVEVEPQADDTIQPVVRWGDGSEHRSDISPLFRTARDG